MKNLFRDLRSVVIAVVVTSLLAAAPAMAAYDAINADTVDGHDAVRAATKPAHRAGKLIAAGKSGYLPNNAIRKAPNSTRLDGKRSSAFIERVSAVDELQTGVWAVSSSGASKEVTALRFLESLHSRIPGSSVYIVQPGQSTVQCPGSGEVVAQGVLCVYINQEINLTELRVRNPLSATFGTSDEGAVILGSFDSKGFAYGTWAARSGD
jgi:hypothetical protein